MVGPADGGSDGSAAQPKPMVGELILRPDGEASHATDHDRPVELRPEPPPQPEDDQGADADSDAIPKLSKNQLKRLRRQQQWEESKDNRKRKRKERRLEKSARRREATEAAKAAGLDLRSAAPPPSQVKSKEPVPVGIIIDCDFEEYMLPQEILSLSGQLVRCYADNKRAEYRTHLYFSGIKGALRERFEGPLRGQHKNWQGVRILEEDFLAAARMAETELRGQTGGTVIDLLSAPSPSEQPDAAAAAQAALQPPAIRVEPEMVRPEYGSVVYLTSDSPNTLTRLEPFTSYIIGGLVDRNREKGLCYRRAREAGVRTARLPIGEFMALSTRHVLTTNQVGEIMLRWLACGDWGGAFMKAIPPRKGGKLKGAPGGEEGIRARGGTGGNDAFGHAVDSTDDGSIVRELTGVAEASRHTIDTNEKVDDL